MAVFICVNYAVHKLLLPCGLVVFWKWIAPAHERLLLNIKKCCGLVVKLLVALKLTTVGALTP